MGPSAFFMSLFLFLRPFQNDACSTNSKESATLYDAPLAWWYLDILNEGASIAVVIAKNILQTSLLVAAHVDGTVVQVNAGVNGFKRCVNGVALLVPSYHVIAYLQGDDLLIVEHVFDDHDAAVCHLFLILCGIIAVGHYFVLLFLRVSQF